MLDQLVHGLPLLALVDVAGRATTSIIAACARYRWGFGEGGAAIDPASTFVYARGVEEAYRFDEASYERLSAAGISWRSVLDVLAARPRWRQHIGAVLRVAAPDRTGRWLGVALIEEADDQYLIVGARELDEAEAQTVRRLLDQGGS